MEYFIGVDVSKEKLDLHMIDRTGRKVDIEPQIPNTVHAIANIVRQCPDPQQTVIVYESTGSYGKKLAHVLIHKLAMVCEVNPMIVKNAKLTMTQTGTDSTAAKEIANAARHLYLFSRQTLTRYNVDTGRDPELAVWIFEYDRLHHAIAKLKQQIDAVRQLPNHAARILQARLQDELQRMTSAQKEVTHIIEEHADSKEVKLVASIKGIGTVTAATVLNRIGNIERFESADQLKSYLGIYPAIRKSGKSKSFAKLAKNGDKLIKHQLFNCAKSASIHNPACQNLYNRLIQKGRTAVYAWTAVMRKLVQIIYGVLKTKTTWNPNYTLTQNG